MRFFLCVIMTLSVELFAMPEAETEISEGDLILETVGPNGNRPTDHKEINISDADGQAVRELELKAAILMHVGGDFSNSVVMGARDVFADYSVEVVTVTDAEFDANKQKTDIETALVLKPDIILTLIVDPVSGAAALNPAIDRGVDLVLLSNLPQDFVHKEDYAAIVTDDLFSMGESIAQMINADLGKTGKVALLYHDADYYVTNQRDQAVETVLRRDFPGIEIVARRGIANPADGEVIASALLTQYSDLDAIYAPWAQIAEGVLAAARASGKDDLRVFTMDLNETVALDMAKDGNMAGIVADLPYEIGVTMAQVGILSRLKRSIPPFITVPATKVSRDNLGEKWVESLRRDLPPEVETALRR